VEVRGGVVYFDGGDEHVHAVNATTGAEIWRSRYGLQSLRDLNVSEQHVAISAQNELVVFDRRNGRRVATFPDPTDRTNSSGGSVIGIPLADGTGRIFVSGAQGLVCFRLR
jgi:outer membrane protein assembly factor BamB